MVENNGHKFVREMRTIVENSPSLTRLGNISSWNNVGLEEVSKFEKWIRSNNYDVTLTR